MSEPKELSPEELRRRLEWLRDLSDDDDTAIADHIAALTARAERAEASCATLKEHLRAVVFTDPDQYYSIHVNADLVASRPHPGDGYRVKVRAEALEEAKADLLSRALAAEEFGHTKTGEAWRNAASAVSALMPRQPVAPQLHSTPAASGTTSDS